MAHKLVLLRHGQSTWNLANRFTGWKDVDLTARGVEEAERSGRVLKEEGFTFDVAFTSVLKRAIRTLWITLDELDQMWIPVHRSWTLNERHYGALTGLNKKESVEEHGPEQVHVWRRSFDVPPPALNLDDERHPRNDPRYSHMDPASLPATECLKDCLDRVIPFWKTRIVPEILAGRCVLISAHGNSLRGLVMHLDGLTPEEISKLNIPTGFPLVYDLDDDLRPLGHRYLGDPDEVRAAIEGVVSQTSVDKP